MVEKLKELAVLGSQPVAVSYMACDGYKETNTPPGKDVAWKPVTAETLLSGRDAHFWLHTSFQTPAADRDETEVRLQIRSGREGLLDTTNPQFIVYVNGSARQALDTNYTWVPLEHGKEHDVYMYLYMGMDNGNIFIEATFETIDLKAGALYYDIHVPYLCLDELDANSYDYITVHDSLSKACMLLDLRDFYSDAYYESIDRTSAYLREEFYGKLCGKSDTTVSYIGHTHIDVTWLWTVAQTREKAQRSFSTVINMMDRYREYIFMSSQPQLYQFVNGNFFDYVGNCVTQ